VDSVCAIEKRLETQIKEVKSEHKTFRDQISEMKERQTRILVYLGIAAVIGGSIVSVAAKVALDRIFPSAPASISAPITPAAPLTRPSQ
jgi:hypothetical protein